MMLRIINGDIYHTRGDTGCIQFIPTIRGQPLTPEQYTAVFTVKSQYDANNPVFQKTIENGRILFLADDTACLQYGDYLYDIQVTIPPEKEGDIEQVDTPIQGKYHLKPDITT